MFETLSIQRRTSKVQAGIFLVCGGLAVAAIVLAALPYWLRLLLLSGFLYQLLRYWRCNIALDSRLAWTTVLYDNSGWRLQRSGAERYVELTGESIVCQQFAILMFKSEDVRAPICVPVFADSTDAENFRRLRVILRFARNLDGGPDIDHGKAH